MGRSRVRWAFVLTVACLVSLYSRAEADTGPAALHRMLASAKARSAGVERSELFAKAASLAQVHYDVSYYDLDIAVNTVTQQISGNVLMKATCLKDNLSQFDLDLDLAMTADSVEMQGAAVAFSHPGSELYITPLTALDSADTFSVQVYYHGPPAPGGFGAFGFDTHGSPPAPIVWSLSEPYYARNWWPCKDSPSDKADSVDIRITCPTGLFASSNGVLISQTDLANGYTAFNWKERHPIVTYLVSLTVSNFTQLDYSYVYNTGADTMPVCFWIYPESIPDAQASYPEVLQMLDAFGAYYGPYPFLDEKYAITQFPWPGGMEHQTNTSQTPASYNRNFTSHELSHQWWGDDVTCRDWKHIWLNEGFASYSEAQYQEWLSGVAAYRSYMNWMEYKGDGTVIVDDTTNVSRIFHSGLSYDKGAWVLHMLRGVLGDPAFYASLAAYRSQFSGQSATTEDFEAVCEQVSGIDLSQFFADWCYGTFYPKYIYSYYTVGSGTQVTAHVQIEQFQSSAPQIFDLPIELSFTNDTSSHVERVPNSARKEWFTIPLSFVPTHLELDPQGWILKDSYAGVAIITDSLTTTQLRTPYYYDAVHAVRGVAPYVWTLLTPDALPAGLTLTSKGVVTGSPQQMGTFRFRVRVYDSGSPTSSMERQVTLVVEGPPRPAGDVNSDALVTSADVIYLVNYVFKSGLPPVPLSFGDLDLSCTITAADIVYLVNFVFKSGPAPLGSCVP